MHELSVVASLCSQAEAAARADGAERITAISVRLGALSHLSPDHLREHLVEAARGSMLEGARLDVAVGTDAADPHAQDIELLSLEVV